MIQLAGHERLTVMTLPRGNPVPDTTIEIRNQAGNMLQGAFDDDSGPGYLSRLEAFQIPISGYYFIVVKGRYSLSSGPYYLVIRKGDCPRPGPGAPAAPKSGDIFINEVLSNIILPIDSNQDNSLTSQDDEFVEVVNFKPITYDLTGLVLRDNHELRHWIGPAHIDCGLTIAPYQSLLVFGGGTPAGDFGNAIVHTAITTALGLDDTLNSGTEYILLLDRDGYELDRMQMTSGVDGVSFSRCDVKGHDTVLHTACPSAQGNYTAGTKLNGDPFTSPQGDTCLNYYPVNINGQTFTGHRTVDFTNDYQPTALDCPSGISGSPGLYAGAPYAGEDAVYSISLNPGQKLTAIMTPNADFDGAIYILSSCSPQVTCEAANDTHPAGVFESVTYTNNDLSMKRVYIVVDAFLGVTPGSYNLTLTVE